MAGMIIKDTRLFIFQALEYGVENNILDKSIYNELEKKGAEIALGVAERFYTIVKASYLRDSANITVGIMNLAAVVKFESNKLSVAEAIKSLGLVKFFNVGWNMVENLSSKAHEGGLDYTNQYICESLKWQQGQPWKGEREYFDVSCECELAVERIRFISFLISKYGGKQLAKLFNIDDIIFIFITSFFIKDQSVKSPCLPIPVNGVRLIAENIVREDYIKLIEHDISKWQTELNDDYKDIFSRLLVGALRDIAQLHQECMVFHDSGRIGDMIDHLFKKLYVNIDTDKAVEMVDDFLINSLKGYTKSELVKFATSGVEEQSCIAALDLLKSYKLTENEVSLIISDTQGNWFGHIDWSKIKWETILGVLKYFSSTDSEEIAFDILNCISGATAKWALKMPEEFILLVWKDDYEFRKIIAPYASLVFKKEHDFSMIILYPASEWGEVYYNNQTGSDLLLIREYLDHVDRYLDLSRVAVVEMLFERISVIVRVLQEGGQEDDPVFADEELKKALQKVLSKEEFKDFLERL